VFSLFRRCACRRFSIAIAEGAPDDVIVENGVVKLTRGDYEGAAAAPSRHAPRLGADPKRVAALLNNMLIGRTMAAEARKGGLDHDRQSSGE
jgi:hypothetical protein